MNLKTKSWIYGTFSVLAMFLFYFVLLSILNSPQHAVSKFLEIWYLMGPLIVGFGIQVGLFVYVKNYCKHVGSDTAVVSTSAGISGGSMIACCTHHFIDVFAILGIAWAASFFVRYQTTFLLIGLAANIFGIFYMWGHLNKMKRGKNSHQKCDK